MSPDASAEVVFASRRRQAVDLEGLAYRLEKLPTK